MSSTIQGDVGTLSLAAQISVSLSAVKGGKVQSTSENSFESMMNQSQVAGTTTKASTQNTDSVTSLQSTAQTNKSQTAANSSKTEDTEKTKNDTTKTDQSKVNDDRTKDTKTTDKDTVKGIKEDAEDAGEKMVKEIAEELDVDEEDVISAMETLGLSLADLLKPENLTQLVMQLSGETDMTALITNADLYQSLQNLIDTAGEMTQEIAADYALEPEEVMKILTDSGKKEGNAIELPTDTRIQEADTQMQPGNTIAQTEDTQTQKTETSAQVLSSSGKENGPKVEIEITKETETPPDELKVVTEENVGQKEDTKGNLADEFKHSEEGTEGQAKNPYQQIVSSLTSAFNEIADTAKTAQTSTTTQTSTVDIINQITEYIKVNVKADTTSMELQLHPQSLGSVKVLIQQAEEGGVVAKFTAQSDAVKNALQSQIVQLQQRFDEQGIKVNAVEVTVDTHAFEQNLEQDQQPDGQTKEQSHVSRIRRINLGDLDLTQGDTEELTDDVRIAKEMMAANGNSVDYTA